jgi:hypothetical protein
MPKHVPPTDEELRAIEALACDATPGPWEALTVMDYHAGEAARVVTHLPPGGDECVFVLDREREALEADQRYIASMHPDAGLRLVREIRRLRRVEERHESLCAVLQHLNTFLERRGLVAQAQRFVEVRAQLDRIHTEGPAPDTLDPRPAPGAAPAA